MYGRAVGGIFFIGSKAQRQVRPERTWTHAVRPKGRQQDVAGQPIHRENVAALRTGRNYVADGMDARERRAANTVTD